MKLSYAIANLKLAERNRDWLAADLSVREKARYYPAILSSYARLAARGESWVRYLGRPFSFDNPATPLNLQTYPYELTRKIRSAIGEPSSILDIGANIGQFSRTASYLWPSTVIDTFEPNPAAYAFLERNTADIAGIRRYNYAIGAEGTADFFYEKGRTGTGSFVESNVAALRSTESISVAVTASPAAVTGCSDYDLIKIDVEGYELTVLDHLAGMTCRCLYLEGSVGRTKSYSHDELFAQVATTFGPFELAYLSELTPGMTTFEATMTFHR